MSRKLLMIPDPIKFESEVMQCMAVPTPSHVDPDFIAVFANSLKLLKEVCQSASGQAFFKEKSSTSHRSVVRSLSH